MMLHVGRGRERGAGPRSPKHTHDDGQNTKDTIFSDNKRGEGPTTARGGGQCQRKREHSAGSVVRQAGRKHRSLTHSQEA